VFVTEAVAHTLPPFFPVPRLKLAILSVCTLGLYEFYWFYKNWQLIKQRENSPLSPFWRAFFAPFFVYPLFQRIALSAAAQHCARISPGFLAAAWFILLCLWRLPDPYWLASTLTFVPLLSVQSAVSELNQKVAPASDTNHRFTPAAIAVCVVGGILFLLAVVGSFLPE
jgi:hypothetical protein